MMHYGNLLEPRYRFVTVTDRPRTEWTNAQTLRDAVMDFEEFARQDGNGICTRLAPHDWMYPETRHMAQFDVAAYYDDSEIDATIWAIVPVERAEE